jgi:shikimate dehydrogenase
MRDRFGGRVRALSESETLEEAADADLIVNSTNAGMDGVSVPLPGITVRAGAALYDMVYVPSPTPLMRLLRAQGASVADGFDMLVCQAAAAFEMWTGREPPIPAMREAALVELRRRGER